MPTPCVSAPLAARGETPTSPTAGQNMATTEMQTETTTSQIEDTSPRAIAAQAMAKMSLEQRVGQVFMLGFDGTTLTASNRALVQGLHIGGVTLFARNITDGPQLAH